MVTAKALHITQVQKTQTKAPVPVVMRQSDQPIGNLGVLIAELGLVAVAGLADAEHCTGQADAHTLFVNGFLRHLTATRRLYHFFSMASFRRAIMDTPMPPNLARHL